MEYIQAIHRETSERVVAVEIATDINLYYIAPNIHDIYNQTKGVVVYTPEEFERYFRKV